MDNEVASIVKAYTVNMTVYRWTCIICGTMNTVPANELLPNEKDKNTKLAICSCCNRVSAISHHTFIKIK